MKNEPLTGYLLHARAYQEKRAIYTFFSREHGVVHGMGARGAPLFVPMSLFATGKNNLKSFSQIMPTTSQLPKTHGQVRYALFYLNEIMCRLIAPEEPCDQLYHAYEQAVAILAVMTDDSVAMRQTLRCFERALFTELGIMPSFELDSAGKAIEADGVYVFDPNQGFVRLDMATQRTLTGDVIWNMQDEASIEHLPELGWVYRQILDNLLDHKPLNSRKLWQQSLKYK